jgi:hypothetical protein
MPERLRSGWPSPAHFQDNEWVDEIGHGRKPIVVKVKHPEIEHTIRVQDFERWLETNPLPCRNGF